MRKIYFFTLIIICFQITKAQNEVPNSSFDNWMNSVPEGWFTNIVLGEYNTVLQVSGHNGGSAAKCQAVTYQSNIQTPILNEIGNGGYGFPITHNYNNFEFYYESNLVGGDTASIFVIIYDSSPYEIGFAQGSITKTESVWTVKDLAIHYTSSGTANSAAIYFNGPVSDNGGNPSTSSYVIFDDISLNMVAGVEDISTSNGIKVFPVPAYNKLTVRGKSDNNNIFQFRLADAAGRIVMEKKLNTTSANFIDEELNLVGIAPGFYYLMMISDKKTLLQKIIVQ